MCRNQIYLKISNIPFLKNWLGSKRTIKANLRGASFRILTHLILGTLTSSQSGKDSVKLGETLPLFAQKSRRFSQWICWHFKASKIDFEINMLRWVVRALKSIRNIKFKFTSTSRKCMLGSLRQFKKTTIKLTSIRAVILPNLTGTPTGKIHMANMPMSTLLLKVNLSRVITPESFWSLWMTNSSKSNFNTQNSKFNISWTRTLWNITLKRENLTMTKWSTSGKKCFYLFVRLTQ